jgi:hypothetical protein
MNVPSTVVVVHDRAAPEARVLLALGPDHLASLGHGLGWLVLDEVVGTSNVLPCEACARLDRKLEEVPLAVSAACSGAVS